MSYTSVITLEEAKTHLRVDGIDSDTEISRMIGSALSMLERETAVIAFARDKEYYFTAGCVNVHDGPINTDFDLIDATQKKRALYSIINANNSDESITLNVGFVDPTDYPIDLKDAALEMIDYWYYRKEGDETMTLIPPSVQAVIYRNARYVL